jgi:cytochrome c
VRIRDGRVIYVEPINVRDQNARIRDIVEDASGRIALLIDGGAVAFVTPVSEEKKVPDGVAGSDSMRGQLIFAQCMGCHNAKDGTAHGIGPDLAGIAGRKIASAPGFTYSAALSSVQDVWTDAHLDRFLAAPQEFAPGTSMGFPGITVASDRAKLVEYLKTLK